MTEAPIRFVQRDADPAVVRRLIDAGILPALARAFAGRGVTRAADLQLATGQLIDPARLLHIDAAAVLLADAIDAGRRLLIVADYDCDGATACAVGIRGLRAFGADVGYLVPNRFEYGYGLTPEIVDLAARDPRGRPDLLITVDNGIASIDGVERAAALGIDVLITDHHLPGARLPAARCIVNPNQPDCGFPSKHLAGVGVMFYVLTALRTEMRRRGRYDAATQPRLDGWLDLVALGTVADVVRLDLNNRVLVSAGLERIRKGRLQPGLAALFQVAGRSWATAQASDLGFAIGPRINAAGRLSDMTIGIECLTCHDPERALELARQLDTFNRERREIEAEMQWDARLDVDVGTLAQRRTITLFNEDWHQGVVGLVAARIKERYHRPTIAFARADAETLRGSGRSIDGVHLRDTLDLVTKAAPDLIAKFGGHAMAAGLTIAAADLPAFIEAFEAATAATAEPALFERRVDVDGELAATEITPGLVRAIERHVWGQGFAPPLFANEVTVVDQRLIKEQHLRLTVEFGAKRFSAIWFRRTEMLTARALLAYRPALDDYQGQLRVQLIVEQGQRRS